MLNRYEVNLLTGGPPQRQSFQVYADTIEAAAIRAGYELQQQQAAEEIRIISNYAFIAWEEDGILCEIVQAEE